MKGKLMNTLIGACFKPFEQTPFISVQPTPQSQYPPPMKHSSLVPGQSPSFVHKAEKKTEQV